MWFRKPGFKSESDRPGKFVNAVSVLELSAVICQFLLQRDQHQQESKGGWGKKTRKTSKEII